MPLPLRVLRGAIGADPPPLTLDGISGVALAVSTAYLVDAWRVAARATVRVERGYGSGVFQDLYPHTDGQLYTAPNGGGVEASAWAAGARLFVETPYNQVLASESAVGHPAAITDATRRVLLDVSLPTSPAFAGISQGTQDSAQSATQRGYDTGISVTLNPGVTLMSLDSDVGSTSANLFSNNGGSSIYLLSDPGNARWYAQDIAVASVRPTTLPTIKIAYADQFGPSSTQDYAHGWAGGVSHANSPATLSATSTPMRLWGAASPLRGRAYAAVIVAGQYLNTAQIGVSGTLVPRLSALAKARYGANEISVYSPISNQAFRLSSFSPAIGSIRIVCASAANRAIEASFNGGAYATIGTTDANGYLVGALSGQSAGAGSLVLRVVGQGTAAATVTNVRLGVVVTRGGQSNADGRGNDITLSATRSLVSNAWTNTTVTQKSWLWALLQDLGATYSSPVAMGGRSVGASYLYFNTAGSTDGRHGAWHPLNPGTNVTSAFAEWVAYAHTQQTEPNFAIWHQGEEDAAGGVTKAQYKAALILMWETFKARTGWTSKLWLMVIGRVGVVADNNVNQIRYALIEAVADRPDLFEMGGSLAHLPVGDGGSDNVHFWTQGQKDAVVAVFKRHAFGSGRAKAYISGSKATSTAVLTFAGGSGSLNDGATPTLGWTCTDGSGAITASGASCSGNVVTLTFDRAISGSLTVKWCSHYSGINATIVDSDATTPLPPEPFEVVL